MVTTGLSSCGQANTSKPGTVERETVGSIRKYEYADSMGKRVIIQNSLSRGIQYTDPDGKKSIKL
jgi:hypothetical protein